MSFLDHALKLARMGFYVFPLRTDSKLPAVAEFRELSTRDPQKIGSIWRCPVLGIEQPFNVGISTSNFGDDERLIAVDVDRKPGKNGGDSLLRLELEGKLLPETFTQSTPTGGLHFLYRTRDVLRNSASKIAPDVDIRGWGGYVVGAGSEVESGKYRADYAPLVEAPRWLVTNLSSLHRAVELGQRSLAESIPLVDVQHAERRAKKYLLKDAPLARSGDGGNHTTYTVVCWLKDLGVPSYNAFEMLLDHWNDRCEPPWTPEELLKIVENAYRYGRDKIGVASPEADFPPVNGPAVGALKEANVSPVEQFNREYAFVLAGGGHHIIWETTDAKGNFELKHLEESSFHRYHAGRTISIGNGKTEALSKIWMSSGKRRTYSGFCFRPGLETPAGYYNLFHGFAVEPLGKGEVPSDVAQKALDRYLEHTIQNVCRGDTKLAHWLIGYLAHLFQRPWEKPHTSLVFRGKKGVGKNAVIARVNWLLGSHARLAANRRYLLGNFNAHLENCLAITFDEAFWSGDKAGEGILKDLITGTHHNIERKGQESYTVDNCTRVFVIGNDEWLVPASHDERRYGVFDVGSKRLQDTVYFAEMQTWMEQGGYRLLLRYLLEYDISTINVNVAPRTQGLLEQKLKSLTPFQRWIFESLQAGEIKGGGDLSDGEWPLEVITDDFRDSFRFFLKENRMDRIRMPDDRSFGKTLHQCMPSIVETRRQDEGDRKRFYKLPSLKQGRVEWEKYIGHPVDWD